MAGGGRDMGGTGTWGGTPGVAVTPCPCVTPRQDPGGRPHFEEVLGTGGDPEDPNPQQDRVDGLRQRRGAPEKGGAPARPPPDPLGWFGVLVPPSLRQAQGSFQRGVTLAVEVAELQGTVDAAATRYRQLLRQKRLLARERGDTETPGDTETTGMPGDVKTQGDTEGGTVTTGDTGTA
ncbi:PREDICTED: coiled-coil domain-containing protein 115 [Lepidothrix coronata]|uniref:Vacuolar ATPase assembly protein VMA22 n=1 Tax=Lepidothrix coronata TaxID=321398 RepID=A0A6J0J8Z4_9PASS|nr:PREDICTED: coiled-coil domain-containing protein 115 [Lepidothrix coronata]